MSSFSPRAESLLEALTLDEKISLLGGNKADRASGALQEGDIYGIARVGLPTLKFADGPVGVHWWTDASTCYPTLLCLAASFDEETAYAYGCAIGMDCRAVGIHVLLAPGVNLYRSPLCGRNFEYFGEDPELSGKLGAAYIRGVQEQGVAATVKHFAANNQEFDRHGISSDVDERTLREIYLRPFEIAITEGHSACVMTAYGLLNGQHCSENAWLTQTVLREEWGFGDGFVMSDWTSVYSTVQTCNSGLDLEMPWGKWLNANAVKEALVKGLVSVATLDAKIRHRLALMERFDWLDPQSPQKDSTLPRRNFATEAVALETARRGIVLLKNEGNVLPALSAMTKSIVVLGHHGDAPILCGGGSAYCPPHESVTLVGALRQVYGPSTTVKSFSCLNPWRGSDAFKAGRFTTPDGQPGLSARYFNNDSFSGVPVQEAIDLTLDITLGEERRSPSLDAPLFSADWRGFVEIEQPGSYDFYADCHDGVCSLALGEKMIFPEIRGTARQILELPAGRHAVHFCYRQTQTGWVTIRLGWESSSLAYLDYDAGLAAARTADLVIVAAGFVSQIEGEGHDRAFDLDARIVELIIAAAAVSRVVVPVLYIGGATQTDPWLECVPAALCVWYPGQNGTLAAAEILAGITNPSGKLPFTWEKQLADRGSFACYHDDDGDRRTTYLDGIFTGYRHFERYGIEPRFAFGHGLSYTAFVYSELLVAPPIAPGTNIEVCVKVSNSGSVPGTESVLLFVGDCEASVPRPPREFKASRRVTLAPGATSAVTFALPPRAFSFWHPDQRAWVLEPGEFIIEVGGLRQILLLM